MSSKSRRRAQNKSSSLPLIGIIGLALVLLVAGLALFLNGQGSAGKAPRLSLDRERIDFGKVPLNKPVKAVFTVTNTGEGNLSLDSSTPVKVVQGC
jgi:uncharacterized membrane protein YphA (DoxX/SURF4 family)